MAPASRVLMIGLDAADPVLVEQWLEDGTLPNLAALRRSGTYGRLKSSARYLAGSPWPTFYTGQPPSQHGIYHDYQWRHEAMGYARPSSQWLTATPFWRTLPADIRVVAYDVPMTLGCADGRGFEISGWASHISLAPPASHPGNLLAEVRRRFGKWPISPEAYGPQPLAELLWLREHLLDNVGRSCEVVLWLLRRPFDFAIVVFSALHRGGHRLWDRSSIQGPVPEAPGRVFDGSLRELYIACDQAIGRLLAAVPADTTVMVFSLHGMTANSTRVDLLDAMLARVLGTAHEASTPRRGLTRRLGEALPLGLRRGLTLAVPAALRDRAMTLWAAGGIDWTRTRAFTLRADLQGYVRINLEGRGGRGSRAARPVRRAVRGDRGRAPIVRRRGHRGAAGRGSLPGEGALRGARGAGPPARPRGLLAGQPRSGPRSGGFASLRPHRAYDARPDPQRPERQPPPRSS